MVAATSRSCWQDGLPEINLLQSAPGLFFTGVDPGHEVIRFLHGPVGALPRESFGRRKTRGLSLLSLYAQALQPQEGADEDTLPIVG